MFYYCHLNLKKCISIRGISNKKKKIAFMKKFVHIHALGQKNYYFFFLYGIIINGKRYRQIDKQFFGKK